MQTKQTRIDRGWKPQRNENAIIETMWDTNKLPEKETMETKQTRNDKRRQ